MEISFLLASLIAVGLLPTPSRAASRVVSIGDLHGDYLHAMRMLRAARLVEATGADETTRTPVAEGEPPFAMYSGARWCGGDAVLVQTGDMVDRGTYGRDLYALFADLRKQAAATGGRVVNLVGNHDSLNMLGDLRYVSKGDYLQFGGREPRLAAFRKDGWIGRQILEEFNATALFDETVFVHAGLLPEHIAFGLDTLDRDVREQLDRDFRQGRPILGSKGPLWVRQLARGGEEIVCKALAQTLDGVGARRMVLGHTQVDDGKVASRCDGRLLLADTIISRDGYPECWDEPMERSGCAGSMTYVELRGGRAFAVRVPAAGEPGIATEQALPCAGDAAVHGQEGREGSAEL